VNLDGSDDFWSLEEDDDEEEEEESSIISQSSGLSLSSDERMIVLTIGMNLIS